MRLFIGLTVAPTARAALARADGELDRRRGKREAPTAAPPRPGRPAAHELARYERLFAQRTRGMRSSAMREMMALTEHPEVISLAGGLPDTINVSPRALRQADKRALAAESTARALQYGPTEGMRATMECIVDEVMKAPEGTQKVGAEEMIVTTGGQQVIDLVSKTLIDPGDVTVRVAEAPTYPGAVPTFSAYEAEVVQLMDHRGNADRRAGGCPGSPARRRATSEVHLHDPQLPQSRRGHDVAGTPGSGWLKWRASASCCI